MRLASRRAARRRRPVRALCGEASTLDRDAPVNAVFFGRVIACRLVVRAAVVPDHDVAFAPLMTVLRRRVGHERSQFVDDRVALSGVDAFDAQDFVLVEIKQLAAGLSMLLDQGMPY